MKKLVWLLALVPMSAYGAELYSAAEKDGIMGLTLKHFWGEAIDSKGQPIEPKDEKERTTVPISRTQAYYMIDKGGETGLAQWCGVEWEPRYLLLMQKMRRELSGDAQIAYTGMLHGVAQGMMRKSMQGETCDKASKQQVSAIIAEDMKTLGAK